MTWTAAMTVSKAVASAVSQVAASLLEPHILPAKKAIATAPMSADERRNADTVFVEMCLKRPNGSRLSCGAKLEYSQTELYSAECRRVTRSIEDGRRQLQAHVRRQPWLGPPHGLFCGATMRRESKIGLRCRTTGGSRRVSPRASIMTISWKKPIPRTSS